MSSVAKTALSPDKRRMGLALLSAGPITQERLQAELDRSGKAGGVLGKALLASGFPKEEEILATLLARIRIPKINVKTTKIPLETIRLVPGDLAKKAKVLPIEKIGDIIVVVSPDIGDADMMFEVRRVTGCLVAPIQCAPEGFEEVLDGYYDRLATSGLGAAPSPVATPGGGGAAAPVAGAPLGEALPVSALPDGMGDWDDAWASVYVSAGPVAAEEALL
jgi:type IV pilus assembly protein PilB